MATPLKDRPIVKKMMAGARAAGARLKGASTGGQATAMAAAGGVGVALVIDQLDQHIEFIGKNWWAGPAAGVVGGHVLARKGGKFTAAGHGVVGGSAAMAVGGYRANQLKQQQQQQGGTTAQGLPSAGRVVERAFGHVRSASGVPSAGRVVEKVKRAA